MGLEHVPIFMPLALFSRRRFAKACANSTVTPSARSICDDVARPPGTGRAFQHDLCEGHWVLAKIAFNSLRDLYSRRGNLYAIFCLAEFRVSIVQSAARNDPRTPWRQLPAKTSMITKVICSSRGRSKSPGATSMQGATMKLVAAIIKRFKLDEVLLALSMVAVCKQEGWRII
jgi:hypothetical protein